MPVYALRPDHVHDGRRDPPEWCDGCLGCGSRPRIRDHAHDHQPSVVLGGHEGHRRTGHHVGDGRERVGCRVCRRDEVGDGLRGGRQEQHAAHELGQGMETQLELGRDAEVAAAAPDRPEQVRMLTGIDPEQLPLGGHDVRRQEVVDGQAVLSNEVAHATAQGQATDAHRSGVSKAGHQPVLTDSRGVAAPAVRPGWTQAVRASRSRSRARISRKSRTTPSSTTPRPALLWPPLRTAKGSPVSRASRDDRSDIRLVRRLHDDPWPAIDAPHEDAARVIVVGITGADDAADDGRPKRDEVEAAVVGRASLHVRLLVRRSRGCHGDRWSP